VYLEENNTEEYTNAHKTRLEALGRANVVSKSENGAWDIPEDYLDRVRAYHQQLAKTLPTPLSRDSVLTISQMETARGATWLDAELSRGSIEEERISKELLDAAAKRRIALRQNKLKAMDVREAGDALTKQMGKAYVPSSGASHIEGVFKSTIERPSGKFAVIEKSREFTLVPWDVRNRERDRGLSI